MKFIQVLASLAIGFGTAQASFKKPTKEFYTALADLTRPDNLKQGSGQRIALPDELQSFISGADGPGTDSHMLYMQHMVEKSMQDMERSERTVKLTTSQDTPSNFYPLNPPSIPLAVKGPCEYDMCDDLNAVRALIERLSSQTSTLGLPLVNSHLLHLRIL